MLHVNINKSHVNIITLHFNMNYLARMGQRVGFADIGAGGFVTISRCDDFVTISRCGDLVPKCVSSSASQMSSRILIHSRER